jgi:DNA-binding transcriptional LysR family regulator
LVDRLSGISIFVQAATAGSFAKAGDQLGLTRSAVGKAVARLEERLNTRLFHRTTRGQSLTDRGRDFYERCLVIMSDLEAAEAILDGDGAAPSGTLRVTAPILFGRQCVAPILVDLTRRHERLELDLRFSDRFVDMVEERIDFAVRIGPLPDRAGQIARKLGTFDMVVCASPSYLSARGLPTSVQDLARHDCLPFSRPGGRAEPWRLMGPDGTLTELIRAGRIRLDDLDAVLEAAVAGYGIACLPSWLVANRVRASALSPVLTTYRAVGNDVYAVRPHAPHLLTKVRTAIDELAVRIPGQLASE